MTVKEKIEKAREIIEESRIKFGKLLDMPSDPSEAMDFRIECIIETLNDQEYYLDELEEELDE